MGEGIRSAMLRFFFYLFLVTSSLAEGDLEEWWSLREMEKPPVPSLTPEESERAENEVDHFIIAAQRGRGLTLSPEADRRTLARRLFYNVIGLPPSPEEMDAFMNDAHPNAYAMLVERLLESPHYGERWARHWLDVVHFGETHGYDKDKPRPNAWPYRDYVIQAFNADKPYARFVKEQLAGDVLYPGTVDGLVAMGFISAGPWDFIGHAEVPEEKIDGKIARHLDRDDMVMTTMNAFCSLTVQCAQCHDHKADPVSMKDYYALQAVFAALDRADRDYDSDPHIARERVRLRESLAKGEHALAAVLKEIAAQRPEAVRQLDAQISAAKAVATEERPRSDRYGYHSRVATSQRTEKWVQVDLGKAVPIDSVVLVGADEYGFADFGFPHQYRVEIGEDITFEKATTVITHRRDAPRPGKVPVVVASDGMRGRYVRLTATKLWSRRQRGQAVSNDWIMALGEMIVVSNGEAIPIQEVTALDSIEAGPRWQKTNLIDRILGPYPLADLTSKGLMAWLEEETRVREWMAKREDMLKKHLPDIVAKQAQIERQLARDREALSRLPQPSKVYAGTVHQGSGNFVGRGHVDGTPRPIHLLRRGQVTQPAEEVQPGTVPGIVRGMPAVFALPEVHAESARRVALAEWITHAENRLTWRSLVNRVWHYHFGQGIVDTPNDFGRIGSEPSHPKLLDWLAVTFRDGGGSLKDLHRLILNSATYKQVSTHRPEMAAIDGSNRFLWRQQRRRLEAEAIRDTVLLIAGKLDTTMHGPSFQDFVVERPEHSPHYQYHKADPDDPKTHRRSIYRFLVRSQPQPFMDTLDCADPSQLVDKRGETNTALQALAMLNNRFMVRMAEHTATRMGKHSDPVEALYRHAFSRGPTQEERETLTRYADTHGLAAMCRMVFNLNEFSFTD